MWTQVTYVDEICSINLWDFRFSGYKTLVQVEDLNLVKLFPAQRKMSDVENGVKEFNLGES